MRAQPLICVADVEASSKWYQRLLGCRGAHGGKHYEQLVKDGSLILQLHSFEVEHHHGAIGNRSDKPYGNGVLLWFEVDDFDSVMKRAAEMELRWCILGIAILRMAMVVLTIGSAGCAIQMGTLLWSRVLMGAPTAHGVPRQIYLCSVDLGVKALNMQRVSNRLRLVQF